MEPTIREATTADAPAIRRVAERGWRAAYEGLLHEETIDAAIDEWYSEEAVRSIVERDDVVYFLAERIPETNERRTLGYITGGPSDEDGVATLGAIYVDPDHWGNGIGTELLSEFEDRCRAAGYSAVRVQVLAHNDAGNAFYAARGYEPASNGETELFGETVEQRRVRKRLQADETE